MPSEGTVTAVIVGLLTLIGVIITVRAGRKNSLDARTVADQARAAQEIATLKQDLIAQREEFDKQMARVIERLDKSERIQRIQSDYIFELRDHVDRKKEPPPPDWPEELRRA